jgi:Heparinase II/III-like protein
MLKTIKYFYALIPVFLAISTGTAKAEMHAVPREHPYLLGTREELRELVSQRGHDWVRVVEVVTQREGGDHERMIGMSLMYVIDGDEETGKTAVKTAMLYVEAPVRIGHVRFGDDLARCAIVYDLCYPLWSPEQRTKFHQYMNETVDANVRSETSPFHNGWYSYKHWGIGLAAYACYHDNPRAPEILVALEKEYRERVVPAFRLAGEGGGWAEGFYVNYWTYEWMFFCDVALRVEGIDYFAMSPEFLGQRAIAGMFESYPGIEEHQSRRQIHMGDGCGKIPGNDRDKTLSARRILVNRFRDDPGHQVVHSFNEATPKSCMVVNAYKDFLWRDRTVKKGDLNNFKLSHFSRGPGYIYARSSWDEDATYFFFKCGDRFTAHQHLDNGHFMIYKHEELAGDGGQYYAWNSPHEVNYYVRTIAHNTVLIHDPQESWPDIRNGRVTGNDGGQHHDWPHHNGAVVDVKAWQAGSELYEIGDMLAFEDRGDYLYLAGDCSRSYSSNKLEYFTRQIVYLRPGTFVIFDRVKSTNPEFNKTWLLQAMKPPTGEPPNLAITNGRGRLFLQTVLPKNAVVKLNSGSDLYSYGGGSYPPDKVFGPLPECRVEVSPAVYAEIDYFLHVLTATDAAVSTAPQAKAEVSDTEVVVRLGDARLSFEKENVGGWIETDGARSEFAVKVPAR